MKKILVTGGSGFIGTNFIQKLIKKNYKVYNIDKLSKVSTPEKFKKNKKNYTFYKINLLQKHKIKKILYKINPDYILNFAAESHVDRSIDDPSHFIFNNIISSTNLFTIFKDFSKKNKKSVFFHISTDEVFGSNLKKPSRENSVYNPSSPYSSSKASTDLIALSFVKTYKLPIKILNLCNNFGPYQFLEKFIPTVIFNLLNNKKVPIYGMGKNIREWIYVDECCQAIISLFKIKTSLIRFNIGSKLRINNITLANKIFKIIKDKGKTKLKKNNFIQFTKDRPGHDLRYALNSNLFYKTTNFKTKKNLDLNLKKTINWYLENSKWVKFAKNKHTNKRIGLSD